ncbi:MAG: hypothetical protein QM773_17245 [Hyphomonadaceae bacterium]
MRFSRPKRLRIISGATLLLLLTGLPVLLGLTRPAPGTAAETPVVAGIYASGLSSLGIAGFVAFALAVVFSLWLMAGQRQEVHRRYLGRSARRHHNLIATLRTLAIVIGAAGLIVGSLSGLYAAMVHARPDIYYRLPLPFFTAELALIGLLGGAALYAAGRFGR